MDSGRYFDLLSDAVSLMVATDNFERNRVLDEDVAIGARALDLRRLDEKSVSSKGCKKMSYCQKKTNKQK